MKENMITERCHNCFFQPILFVAVPQISLRYAMGIKMNRVEYFRAREEATMSPMGYMTAKQADPESIELLDVREGPTSAISERIPGAINISLNELTERMSEIPKEKRIAVCCWDTWCNLGTKACIILLENGIDAVEMIGGIAAWKIIGFPLEKNK